MLNATERAYNEILRRILTMELPPGTYISRNDIAEQLEISKTPIREALQLLEQDRLVKIFPQSKTLVTKINIDEIKRSNFLRVAIETEVIRHMIANYDEDAMKKMEANLKRQKAIVEDLSKLDEFDELDKEFHDIMFKSVGQEELNVLLRSKLGHKKRANRLELPINGKATKIYEDHKAIYDAIKERNQEKADIAIRTHLSRTISRIDDLKKEKPHFFDWFKNRLKRLALFNLIDIY